jgi:hypothetical protein
MGKDLEGSGRSLIELLSRSLPEITKEPHEKTQDSWGPGRDSNLAVPKYESLKECYRYVNPSSNILFFMIRERKRKRKKKKKRR